MLFQWGAEMNTQQGPSPHGGYGVLGKKTYNK